MTVNYQTVFQTKSSPPCVPDLVATRLNENKPKWLKNKNVKTQTLICRGPQKLDQKSNFWGFIFMAKYSLEFKLEIVKHYLGNYGGYRAVAKKYNIQESIVRRWVNSYQQFGIEGLKRSKNQTHYAVDFKLSAVKLYETTEMSYREVANSLGMNNPSLLCNWRTTILKKGVDGLSDQRGRPPKMGRRKKADKKVFQDPKKITREDVNVERLRELENENRDLRIENEFLKELGRLQEAEKQQQRNK